MASHVSRLAALLDELSLSGISAEVKVDTFLICSKPDCEIRLTFHAPGFRDLMSSYRQQAKDAKWSWQGPVAYCPQHKPTRRAR